MLKVNPPIDALNRKVSDPVCFLLNLQTLPRHFVGAQFFIFGGLFPFCHVQLANEHATTSEQSDAQNVEGRLHVN